MTFSKVNIKEEIKDIKINDPEFEEVYDEIKKESELKRQPISFHTF